MNKAALLTFCAVAAWGSGNRTTPPTLDTVSPQGVARGTTAELTVEGLNLAGASAIYFSEPGVTGKILRIKEVPDLPDIRLGSNGTPSTIDVGPLPPRNQVTVEVDVAPDAEIGPVRFRLLTPLGTSPEGRFLIEPYYGETADREPNDSPETAFETFLPTILAGVVSRPGDVDYYRIRVKPGQQISFLNGAMQIGSSLQPVVSILDSELNIVREFGLEGGTEQLMFAYRFEKAGTYYIRVTDYQHGGSPRHFYRIIAGEFPLVRSTWPLGIRKGATAELGLRGSHVAAKVKASGTSNEDTLAFRPQHAFNEVRITVGDEPEVESQGGMVPLPVTINGRIDNARAENRYRFRGRKGEQLILEVNARRLGSDLDSYIEVLDAQGRSIERGVVRPVWETSTTLADKNSVDRGIRLLAWTGLQAGDYVMIGAEIMQLQELPQGPDADTLFESFGGQRLAFFDTSAEAHAIDTPAYRVQILPPGTKLSPNGLPVAHLYYRNDDGGPGYGKDSLVHFTAPSDGEYIVSIRDVQGLGGDNYPFRLTIRRPRPDFRLTVFPRNPNVPAGGSIPVTVTASRVDGFDGPIDVSIEGLPAGIAASRAKIQPEQVSTTLILTAGREVKLPTAVPLRVVGRDSAHEHQATPDDRLMLVGLMPRPDLTMMSETKEVTLAPGGSAQIAVSITRDPGFQGRVPVEVRNLPPRVLVPDVGLNGVLINEDESRRSFTIEALPSAEPGDHLIYVSGLVETRSPQASSYAAPEPIRLRIVKPQTATAEIRSRQP